MRERFLWALAAALVLVAVVTLVASSTASAAEQEMDPKALFVDTHKCSMCHSVAAAKVEAKTSSDKMKGPDLSGYETKKSFAELAAFVRKSSQLDGKEHKKGFKGSDEELQAILDWLGSLEPQK